MWHLGDPSCLGPVRLRHGPDRRTAEATCRPVGVGTRRHLGDPSCLGPVGVARGQIVGQVTMAVGLSDFVVARSSDSGGNLSASWGGDQAAPRRSLVSWICQTPSWPDRRTSHHGSGPVRLHRGQIVGQRRQPVSQLGCGPGGTLEILRVLGLSVLQVGQRRQPVGQLGWGPVRLRRCCTSDSGGNLSASWGGDQAAPWRSLVSWARRCCTSDSGGNLSASWGGDQAAPWRSLVSWARRCCTWPDRRTSHHGSGPVRLRRGQIVGQRRQPVGQLGWGPGGTLGIPRVLGPSVLRVARSSDKSPWQRACQTSSWPDRRTTEATLVDKVRRGVRACHVRVRVGVEGLRFSFDGVGVRACHVRVRGWGWRVTFFV
jgi:hypothetical protein